MLIFLLLVILLLSSIIRILCYVFYKNPIYCVSIFLKPQQVVDSNYSMLLHRESSK